MKEVTLSNGAKVFVRTEVDLAYVIQGQDEAGVVKVGRSKTPDKRVAGLISGIPFKARLVAVLGNGAKREREMKTLLAEYKLRGEWFEANAALNTYLQSARADNDIFVKVTTDENFFKAFIQPAILEYLNGRRPNYTTYGDFVYRVLQCGYPAIDGRAATLIEACPNGLSPELIAGYVPLGVDDLTPQIRVSDQRTVEAAQ